MSSGDVDNPIDGASDLVVRIVEEDARAPVEIARAAGVQAIGIVAIDERVAIVVDAVGAFVAQFPFRCFGCANGDAPAFKARRIFAIDEIVFNIAHVFGHARCRWIVDAIGTRCVVVFERLTNMYDRRGEAAMAFAIDPRCGISLFIDGIKIVESIGAERIGLFGISIRCLQTEVACRAKRRRYLAMI